MTVPLHLAPVPCSTCPYRADHPSGTWNGDEYEKLRGYDLDPAGGTMPPLATFHCHQQNATGVETVCRGWLATHPDTVAVRLAISRGALTVEQRDAAADTPGAQLHPSGTVAADHGAADLARPGPRARRAINALHRKGAAR